MNGAKENNTERNIETYWVVRYIHTVAADDDSFHVGFKDAESSLLLPGNPTAKRERNVECVERPEIFLATRP